MQRGLERLPEPERFADEEQPNHDHDDAEMLLDCQVALCADGFVHTGALVNRGDVVPDVVDGGPKVRVRRTSVVRRLCHC